jgi:endonuclease IV
VVCVWVVLVSQELCHQRSEGDRPMHNGLVALHGRYSVQSIGSKRLITHTSYLINVYHKKEGLWQITDMQFGTGG